MIVMDDNKYTSTNIISATPSIKLTKGMRNIDVSRNQAFKGLLHSAGLYNRNDIDFVNKRYRFGVHNLTDEIHTTKEYLFFTKPDLNIYPTNNMGSLRLNDGLINQPYWLELVDKHPEVLFCLQDSLSISGDHFNHLLENCVQSNLSIPGLSSEMIDTPTNLYGIGYQYHGSAEASDDSFDFSLEFKDVKGLPVYHFFKAYEDYQILKHHGVIVPNKNYVVNKILNDQYCIFKFLVDEDGESLVYYAQLYGVKSKSIPREVFDSTSYDNGLSYSIDFNAAFFDDMKPQIIKNFNLISEARYNNAKYQVSIHNELVDRADGRSVCAAYIVYDPSRKVYKLKWRGDDEC